MADTKRMTDGDAVADSETIGELLVAVGAGLERRPAENAANLRQGIDKLEELAAQSGDADDAFVTFFLKSFVVDVWDNIAMAPSQRIDDDDIEAVLRTIGEHFNTIGRKIQENEYAACYADYVALLEEYREHIETIKAKRDGR